MKPKLSVAFWEFVLPITATVSIVISITTYNALKYLDRILLELYLEGELETPIKFTYKRYLEELESYDEFLDGNLETINDTGNSRIFKSPRQLISKLRGGKNFNISPNNWKEPKPVTISRTGLKLIAISLVCSTAGLTTVCLVQNIQELKRLSAKDISIIKNCIDNYCKVHKINFLQLTFNKKLWESFIDAVYLCIDSNLEFKITRQQYFILIALLKSLKTPTLIPLYIGLMFLTLSLGIGITGAAIYLIAAGNLILATLICTGWGSILLWDIMSNQSLFRKKILKQLVKILILVNQPRNELQLPAKTYLPPVLPSYFQIENQVPRFYQENYPLEKTENPYKIYEKSKSLNDILRNYHSEQAFLEKRDLPTIKYTEEPSVEEPNP
jgi:hypothetical protein